MAKFKFTSSDPREQWYELADHSNSAIQNALKNVTVNKDLREMRRQRAHQFDEYGNPWLFPQMPNSFLFDFPDQSLINSSFVQKEGSTLGDALRGPPKEVIDFTLDQNKKFANSIKLYEELGLPAIRLTDELNSPLVGDKGGYLWHLNEPGGGRLPNWIAKGAQAMTPVGIDILEGNEEAGDQPSPAPAAMTMKSMMPKKKNVNPIIHAMQEV